MRHKVQLLTLRKLTHPELRLERVVLWKAHLFRETFVFLLDIREPSKDHQQLTSSIRGESIAKQKLVIMALSHLSIQSQDSLLIALSSVVIGNISLFVFC